MEISPGNGPDRNKLRVYIKIATPLAEIMCLSLHRLLVSRVEQVFWRYYLEFCKLPVQFHVSVAGLGFEFSGDNLKITSQVALKG